MDQLFMNIISSEKKFFPFYFDTGFKKYMPRLYFSLLFCYYLTLLHESLVEELCSNKIMNASIQRIDVKEYLKTKNTNSRNKYN